MMTVEEIQNAAFKSIDAPCERNCGKCESEYKEDCSWMHYVEGFEDGVKWFINNLWHDSSCFPARNMSCNIGELCLIITLEGKILLAVACFDNKNNLYYFVTSTFNMIYLYEVKVYMYINDLDS